MAEGAVSKGHLPYIHSCFLRRLLQNRSASHPASRAASPSATGGATEVNDNSLVFEDGGQRQASSGSIGLPPHPLAPAPLDPHFPIALDEFDPSKLDFSRAVNFSAPIAGGELAAGVNGYYESDTFWYTATGRLEW